jgi:hypothetical protein
MLEGVGFCHRSVGSVVVEESRMLRFCNHGDAAGTDLGANANLPAPSPTAYQG